MIDSFGPRAESLVKRKPFAPMIKGMILSILGHAINLLALRLARPEAGQTLVEYSILTGTVALAVVGFLFIMGEAVGGPFLEASKAIQDALKDISAGDEDGGDSL
jgi:Flp pilus assembly pilin Flp